MRLVIDTNVLVSAALKDSSVPALAVRAAIAEGTILKSSATEAQLFAVLARPHISSLVPRATLEWLTEVMNRAEVVTVTEAIRACRDPSDNAFLELAVNGRAQFIITGDQDLLTLHPFGELPIITPATFIQAMHR